jgi:hypothetical protein
MEGQSMTVLNVPDGNKLGKFMVYGRNSCGSPKLWKFAETDGMEQKLKEAFKATKHIYAVQGEHTASDVQDGIYKNGEHFYVYLVKDLTDMKSLSSVEMSEFCDKFGFETVPFITSGKELNSCFKNVDDMQEYVEHQWFKVDGTVNRLDDRYDKLPKVKSAVIRMTRNKVTDLGCDEKLFKRLVKTVFNQRRKMLRVSLKQMFPGVTPREDFYTTDIMTKRPEQLTIQQFVELTNYVGEELKRLGIVKS